MCSMCTVCDAARDTRVRATRLSPRTPEPREMLHACAANDMHAQHVARLRPLPPTPHTRGTCKKRTKYKTALQTRTYVYGSRAGSGRPPCAGACRDLGAVATLLRGQGRLARLADVKVGDAIDVHIEAARTARPRHAADRARVAMHQARRADHVVALGRAAQDARAPADEGAAGHVAEARASRAVVRARVARLHGRSVVGHPANKADGREPTTDGSTEGGEVGREAHEACAARPEPCDRRRLGPARREGARRVGPSHPNISTHGRAFAASTGERAEPQARREHRMWRGAHAQHAG